MFYKIEIPEEYYKEEYIIVDDNKTCIAKWVDINEFKNRNKKIYPEEVFKYI